MVALISVSALFGSCQKEQKEYTRLELVAEGFQNNDNGTKLAVDGVSSMWVDGEKVRINDNGELTISYTSGMSASVAGEFTTPIRAIYPASICTGDLTSGTATVTLPSEYQYATDGVHQILESPMAAYSASGNEVHFKHLTAALTVSVYNNIESTPIYIDAITVTSSEYEICGSMTVNFDNLESTGSTIKGISDNSVTLRFDNERVSLASGATGKYQIPVRPVGDAHNFTVVVTYHTEKNKSINTKQCYTLTKSQTSSTGHALQRAQLGYVPVTAKTSGDGITADWLPKVKIGYNSYYLISSPFQMVVLSANSKTASELEYAKYRLLNDIDMNYSGAFTTIYNCSSFNGLYHTISNLRIEDDGDGYCGMITGAGYIQNLTLNNPKLYFQHKSAANNYVGTLVSSTGPAYINNCTVNNPTVYVQATAEMNSSTCYMGGLVGNVESGSTIENSTVSGFDLGVTEIGQLYFGGLVGNQKNNFSLEMTNSSFSTTKDMETVGPLSFGGLVGAAYDVEQLFPVDCSVDVTATLRINNSSTGCDFYVGSLLGKYTGSAEVTIGGTKTDCTGNTTTGHITTVYTDKVGTKYIGSSTNRYVCGSTKVTSPNNQSSSTLNLTIE